MIGCSCINNTQQPHLYTSKLTPDKITSRHHFDLTQVKYAPPFDFQQFLEILSLPKPNKLRPDRIFVDI
jgi:hypothetical protein